jgi:prophage regulatory protein
MTNTTPIRFLSFDELKGLGIRYCRSQIWRLERDGKFPKRVPIGEARVGWVESEIASWQEQRIRARDAKARNATAA